MRRRSDHTDDVEVFYKEIPSLMGIGRGCIVIYSVAGTAGAQNGQHKGCQCAPNIPIVQATHVPESVCL